MHSFPIFSVHLNDCTTSAEENRTTVSDKRTVDASLFSDVATDTYSSDWEAA